MHYSQNYSESACQNGWNVGLLQWIITLLEFYNTACSLCIKLTISILLVYQSLFSGVLKFAHKLLANGIIIPSIIRKVIPVWLLQPYPPNEWCQHNYSHFLSIT